MVGDLIAHVAQLVRNNAQFFGHYEWGRRALRLMATPPQSEKPWIFTFGAPGAPLPTMVRSKPPITPRPRISTLTSGGSRMFCALMIDTAWMSTSVEVKSA